MSDGVKHFMINCGLKLFVVLIYIVSHVYDYVSYPFYYIYYHPWRVRRYKKASHARKEEREDCVIYHSIQVFCQAQFFLIVEVASHVGAALNRFKLEI